MLSFGFGWFSIDFGLELYEESWIHLGVLNPETPLNTPMAEYVWGHVSQLASLEN